MYLSAHRVRSPLNQAEGVNAFYYRHDAEIPQGEAAADIPTKVRERLITADELSDEDRETIIQIASKSLARFQPKPEANGELKSNESASESLSRPEPIPEPEQKAE